MHGADSAVVMATTGVDLPGTTLLVLGGWTLVGRLNGHLGLPARRGVSLPLTTAPGPGMVRGTARVQSGYGRR